MQNRKCLTKIKDLKMIIITKKYSNKINYFLKLKMSTTSGSKEYKIKNQKTSHHF